jgi:hypothetical protein
MHSCRRSAGPHDRSAIGRPRHLPVHAPLEDRRQEAGPATQVLLDHHGGGEEPAILTSLLAAGATANA